jgi:hypothetical protein
MPASVAGNVLQLPLLLERIRIAGSISIECADSSYSLLCSSSNCDGHACSDYRYETLYHHVYAPAVLSPLVLCAAITTYMIEMESVTALSALASEIKNEQVHTHTALIYST